MYYKHGVSKYSKVVNFGGENMKTWVKIVIAVLLVVFVSAWILPHLPYRQDKPNVQYKGIIEVWHVESFEGGQGSRASWLRSRATELEKRYSGLYFDIATLTYSQLTDKLEEGQLPDLISFSIGVGNTVLPFLQPYNGSVDCYDNLLMSGEADNTVYAVPYCAGMYSLFARQKHLDQLHVEVDSVISSLADMKLTVKQGKNTFNLVALGVGFAGFNSPLSALSGVSGVAVDMDNTQYTAYEKYLTSKSFVTLLGTQRDVFRLGNRLEQGRTDSFETVVLDGYTDLVQYVGISTTDNDKLQYCRQFVEHIVSSDSQKKLVSVGMLSVSGQCDYSDITLSEMQRKLSMCEVPCVFESHESILSRRQTASSGVQS